MRDSRNLIVCLIGLSLTGTVVAADQQGIVIQPAVPAALPSAPVVEKTVKGYLAGLSHREENDLLSQGDIAPLYEQLFGMGWDVADQEEIQELLLKDSDWLVRTLRTKKGMVFMRDMENLPGGYDRVDRMRQQPHGKVQLEGLINTPDGAKLIEYLTTTKQGKQTGKDLKSPGQRRGNFTTPTGRLYTKADVLKRLMASYEAEVARRTAAESAGAQQ